MQCSAQIKLLSVLLLTAFSNICTSDQEPGVDQYGFRQRVAPITRLIQSAKSGNLNAVKGLLATRWPGNTTINVNQIAWDPYRYDNKGGLTALVAAAKAGHPHIIRELLIHGAQLTPEQTTQLTPRQLQLIVQTANQLQQETYEALEESTGLPSALAKELTTMLYSRK